MQLGILEISALILGVPFWYLLIKFLQARQINRKDNYQQRADDLIEKYRATQKDSLDQEL